MELLSDTQLEVSYTYLAEIQNNFLSVDLFSRKRYEDSFPGIQTTSMFLKK